MDNTHIKNDISSLSDSNAIELKGSGREVFDEKENTEYQNNISPYSSTKLLKKWVDDWGRIVAVAAAVITVSVIGATLLLTLKT